MQIISKFVAIGLLTGCLVGFAGAEPEPAPDSHQHHHGNHSFSDTEKYIKRFEDPTRDEWQKPDMVVDMLALKAGMNVADIGAATGYFTRRMAKKVMPGGYALGVDIEDGFFSYLVQRGYEDGVFNLFPVKALPDDPRLPDSSLDVVLIVDTLHHIEGRAAYYEKLKKSLRPGGRVVVVDFKKDADIPVGPGPEMRLRATAVKAEFEAAGFQVTIDQDMLPYQYIVVATRSK